MHKCIMIYLHVYIVDSADETNTYMCTSEVPTPYRNVDWFRFKHAYFVVMRLGTC